MEESATARTVLGPFQEMWVEVVNYMPSLLAGLLILVLGALVCWLVKALVVRILILMRLDRAARGMAWARALSQADVRYALANALGNAAAGVVFLIFLNNAVLVWHLEVVAKLIGSLVFYLPRLIVGLAILVAGSIIASVVATRVRTGLAAEGFAKAALTGRIVHWTLVSFVVACTLEEMAIAPHTVGTALKIGLGSAGLVAALAFGLGSKDAVARMWAAFGERSSGEKKLP